MDMARWNRANSCSAASGLCSSAARQPFALLLLSPAPPRAQRVHPLLLRTPAETLEDDGLVPFRDMQARCLFVVRRTKAHAGVLVAAQPGDDFGGGGAFDHAFLLPNHTGQRRLAAALAFPASCSCKTSSSSTTSARPLSGEYGCSSPALIASSIWER